MDSDLENAVPHDTSLDLDPFGFMPDSSSRIPGLGGTVSPADPAYAFHTPYVPVARGTVNFDVQFDNLAARRGTLVLRVHMLPDESGSIARLVNSERIQLNRLVAQGGALSIATEGFRGVTYALIGAIPDASDITADGLSIRLDRRQDQHESRAALSEGRSTIFGNGLLKPSPHLLARGEPRFSEPVSQPFTRNQAEDPSFKEKLGAVSDTTLDDIAAWELAYAMQVFESYGMLAAGAEGLGLLSKPSALPRMLALAGPSVRVVMRNSGNLDAKSYGEGIQILDADPVELPDDVVNLDFLWTDHFCDQIDPKEAIEFIDNVTDRLRPGGLSLHFLTIDLRPSYQRDDAVGSGTYSRGDVERLALTLISRGHEVARLRPGLPSRPQHRAGPLSDQVTSFAFVVRRARSAI